MKRIGVAVVWLVLAVFPLVGRTQETNIEPMLSTDLTIEPMLSTDPIKAGNSPKVIAVYGITEDDYLPLQKIARQTLRPKLRAARSHPAFDLPDAVFFAGGAVFILMLLGLVASFIKGFEEEERAKKMSGISQNSNVK